MWVWLYRGSGVKRRTAPERARWRRLINPGHIETLLTTHSGIQDD